MNLRDMFPEHPLTVAGPRIASIAYSLGEVKTVASLEANEGIAPSVISSLKDRGLHHYCEDDRSISQMCVASIRETMASSQLAPDDIDAIVIGPSMAYWNLDEEHALLTALNSAGFSKSQIIGVTMQACSVVASALQIARDFVNRGGRQRRVLVVVFGQRVEGDRIAPQATTLFSDGAVSCIVSRDRGNFEILATDSITDTTLATMEWSSENFPKYFQAGVALLRKVIVSVYSQVGVKAENVAAAIGTNGSTVYLQMIGLAAGLPPAKVHKTDLARYAHVYGCDNLIGLHNRNEEAPFSAGQYVLLVAWAPLTVSACLLRCVA